MNWTQWPPSRDDARRIRGYDAALNLYRGRQGPARYNGAKLLEVGRSVSQRLRQIGIIENFPRVLSNISSSLLFSRRPTFTVGEDPPEPSHDSDEAGQTAMIDSPGQQALNKIIRDNEFSTILQESGNSQSFAGDVVFRVRWGQHPMELEPRVIIEELPAENFFVTSTPSNPREILSQQIAWLLPEMKGDDQTGHGFLCCQEHFAGYYENTAFSVSNQGDCWKIGDQMDLADVYTDMVPADRIDHDVPGSLLFHVPNDRICSQYFGDSDYLGLETIFEAINNRISKIDQYLDKHAAPKLVLPPGLIKQDGTLNLSDLDVIEGAQTELLRFLPRYVTWDGQINGSLAQLEHYLETLCRIARIAPAFFGLDKAGSIESGSAMRMRFFATTSLIDKKKEYYDPVLKKLLRAALDLHQQHTGVNTQGDVEIFWRHGLPVDNLQTSQIEISRVAAQTRSRETAICHMDGVSRIEARKEIALIQSEAIATENALAGNVGPAGPMGTTSGPHAAKNGPGGGQNAAQLSKNPGLDPLTAQEQSPSSSLPGKALKGIEINVAQP